MGISGLHLLLTYRCIHECDHCFLFGVADAKGVMKVADIREVYREAKKVRTVQWILRKGGLQ